METFNFTINLIVFFVFNTFIIIIIILVKNWIFLIIYFVFVSPATYELIKQIKLKRTTLNNTDVNRNDIFILSIDQSANNSQSNQFQHSNGANLDSQFNQNQSTEPPPYHLVTIELPSYEEAVKHENTNGNCLKLGQV